MKKLMVIFWFCLGLVGCNGRFETPLPPTLLPASPPATNPPPLPTTANTSPMPWNGRNLTGSLVFVRLQPGKVDLQKLNLVTGEQTTLFAVPEQGWLSQAAVSPDGSQIALAYAPPPSPNQVQFGYSDLYLMPADGSAAPQLLSRRVLPDEIFFSPVWSADGTNLYYAHVAPAEGQQTFITYLEQLNLVTGEQKQLAQNALWPRLSADGQHLAYITTDPQNQTNRLYVAAADGSQATLLIPAEQFVALDAPLFSPDGAFIYFTAVSFDSPISWWDNWLGVETAVAHNLPSDWWRIPVTGGEPEQLTRMQMAGLYGAFAPDGKTVAFTAQTGIFVMNPDGSEVLQRLETAPTAGLSWVAE